jgi:hypothetical protein
MNSYVFTFLIGCKIDWQEATNNVHVGPRVEIQFLGRKSAAARQGEGEQELISQMLSGYRP